MKGKHNEKKVFSQKNKSKTYQGIFKRKRKKEAKLM